MTRRRRAHRLTYLSNPWARPTKAGPPSPGHKDMETLRDSLQRLLTQLKTLRE